MELPNYENIKIYSDDSPDFINLLNKIVGTLVFQYGINELYYVRIKNWFDHKWLNYSGKAVVNFPYGYTGLESEFISSLDAKWQDKITVPPFHPDRILSQTFVIRNGKENNMLEKFVLHKRKSSNDNLHNRISKYSENGLFIWYSSNTKIIKRGSLMIYRIQENELETFYASFENKDSWTITKTKGIDINELKVFTTDVRP